MRLTVSLNEGKRVSPISSELATKEAREERNLAADLKRLLPQLQPDLFNIAVLHCNVANSSGHANYAPCKLEDVVSSGFDYWALGHVHERKQLCERPAVVYPGNSQGRNIRERGAKGAVLVNVDHERRVQTELIATDTVRWELETVSISGIENSIALSQMKWRKLDTTSPHFPDLLARLISEKQNVFEDISPSVRLIPPRSNCHWLNRRLTQWQDGRTSERLFSEPFG